MTDRQTVQPSPGATEALAEATWRKSSFSGTQGNCVEVTTNSTGVVVVRDSKDHSGGMLIVTRQQWRNFIRDIMA